MWLVAWALPSMRLVITGQAALAAAMALVGVLIIVMGIVECRRARTTVNPLNPGAASSLVVQRVYAVTRNPMYLGLALILLAWAVFLAHPLSLFVVPGFVLYMNRFQITPEERALEALFGSEFKLYSGRVRRWL